MINKVSFTGRETLLTDGLAKPLEQKVIMASTYIEEALASKVAKAPKKSAEAIYSSPFAPIGEGIKPANAGDILFTFG